MNVFSRALNGIIGIKEIVSSGKISVPRTITFQVAPISIVVLA